MSDMDSHEKRLVFWWLLLSVLSVISLETAPAFNNKAIFAGVVMVIAFVKVRIVIREFMEVRAAPIALQLVLDVWAIAICTALIIMIV
jgi:hypothetical protein